jgi:hypothetical protein
MAGLIINRLALFSMLLRLHNVGAASSSLCFERENLYSVIDSKRPLATTWLLQQGVSKGVLSNIYSVSVQYVGARAILVAM